MDTPTSSAPPAAKPVYFALSGYGWGKGETPSEAARNCRSQAPRGKSAKIKVYECHPSTEIINDGMEWQHDKDTPSPREIDTLPR